MEDKDTRRPADWYPADVPAAEEIAAWYAKNETAPARPLVGGYPVPEPVAPTQPPEGPERRRRRKKLLWIFVCAVIVLAALFAALEDRIGTLRQERAEAAAEAPQKAAEPSDGFSFRFGTGDEEKENDYEDDFRDYFAQYYSNSSEVAIERTETGADVTLLLRPHRGAELTLQEIYERVSPAVVGVTTYRDGEEYSWGTGVLFTEDGYIVTNTHILQGADACEVSLTDGTSYAALLVGEDEASDIAVLKIDGAGLPTAEFGDSDELRVGDSVAAIGNPLGEMYAGTMTNGIISAINRNVTNNGHSMTLLQTNAALNEGNSGGPLVNAYGQVVGITNMKIMSVYYSTVEGIGFAIPSAVVKTVANQLIEHGLVLGNPTIGILAGPVSEEAMDVYGLPEGVYVSEVNEGSDAKEKGLQVGDIILEVNGIPVASVPEVNAIKDQYAVGDTITLTVYREGETFELEIALVDKSDIRS